LLQPLNEKLEEIGDPVVACDTVQAGINDIVFYEGGREAALGLKNWFNPSDLFYEGGREAALGLKNWFNPSDLTIMGIVDQVNIGE